MEKEIIFLEPVMKENVWGGQRLITDFPYHAEGKTIGECWGISAHPHGDCTIKNGSFAGGKLSELYASHRELFGNIQDECFPLLVKIIDARENLSIQVHPDDAYARVHENGSLGKTECWYVMDCREDAYLVIGHNAKTREELTDMIREDRYEELIRKLPIQKGDFIQINPGTVHAITGGVMILETQQSSDITYRVYDYNRLVDGKPRQIHVKQSIEVINVPDEADKKAVRHAAVVPQNELFLLEDCPFYKVFKVDLKGEMQVNQEYPFLLISVLDGEGYADGVHVCKGDHMILPASYGACSFQGSMQMILSTVS